MERFWIWLSWKSPRRFIYWATIRLAAHATTGKFSDTIVPELTVIDALTRWECNQQLSRNEERRVPPGGGSKQ